ncbi:MAG TPA: SRPBCC family protein, partial [Kofleriaceae bacterium]
MKPTVTQSIRTFRIQTSVKIAIRATPAAIWTLLTDAAKFPSWNHTVTRIDGVIARGNKLSLRVPAAPKRVFKPRVTELEPEKRMVWSEGVAPMFQGVRTYTLTPNADGTTEFE